MELQGSTFLLRSWRAGDEQSLASHANNPKLCEQRFAIVVGEEAVGGIGVQPKTGVHSYPASRRVLEKAAFELEGTLRANAIKDGELLDTYLYAKLAI